MPRLTDEVAHETWRQIGTQAGRTILVAADDTGVLGTVDCTVLPKPDQGRTAVHAGRERRGSYKVQLLSRATRDAAHDFYQAQGFEPVAQGFRRYL